MAIIGLSGVPSGFSRYDEPRGRIDDLFGGGGIPHDLIERGAEIRRMGQIGGPGAGGGLFDPFGQTGVGMAPTNTPSMAPSFVPGNQGVTRFSMPSNPAPIFPAMPQVPTMGNLPMQGGMVDFNALAGLLAGPLPDMSQFFPQSQAAGLLNPKGGL